MPQARKKRPRRVRRQALVFGHLERVSREFLVEHPDIVRQFLGRNTGIYALYRRNKLYYVGLASAALRHRLTAHGKNRHGDRWDHFSIYLTINDQHLREIEALLLRITRPPGARQSGKLAQSRDMKRQIRRAIREKHNREVSSLFGGFVVTHDDDDVGAKSRGDADLIRLLPTGARLRAVYKGKVYRARARRDGRVRYAGRQYQSLSLAGKAVVGRAVNGWWFWQIERGKGNWVRLTKVRRAGTPIYSR